MKLNKSLKITLIFTLIFSIGLFSNNIIKANDESKILQITADILNVRSGPGLDYSLIGQVTENEEYEILEEVNNWFKINISDNNKEGWVAGDFVKIISSSSSPTLTATPTVDILNVRSGPSTSFSIIEQINPDKKYPIIDEEGDWIKIQLNSSKTGWIASWFIEISENIPSEETLKYDLATIEAEYLNVRSGPSTEYDIIDYLEEGDKVRILNIIDGWYKIEINNISGYIASKYVNQIKENNDDTSNDLDKKVIVNTEILNLRSKPNTESQIVGKLYNGDKLIVINSDDDWLYIAKENDQNIKGWVAGWLVAEQEQFLSNQPKVTILYPSTNLREGPSTNHQVIGRANTGDEFPIISTEGDWYQIELDDGKKAFVAGWIVSTKGLDNNITRGIDKILDGKTIVIDAGHGGRDDGATGFHFNSVEKELNLDVAKKLEKKLEAVGANVIMTRSYDTKVSLEDRVYISAINDADAFISIHHNTNSNPYINGTITYYYDNKDKKLAETIQSEVIKQTNTDNLNARYGNYFVLRENSQVAVLIELAFISNYHDELKARSEMFKESAAEGIFQGIIKYFSN